MAAIVKTPDELKSEAADLVRAEREARLDRKAKDARDGTILDAFDRMTRGELAASEQLEPLRHPRRRQFRQSLLNRRSK
jgi:hypothetical protein